MIGVNRGGGDDRIGCDLFLKITLGMIALVSFGYLVWRAF